MAAVGIVGLAIGSAANLRTVLLSVRQRYEHLSDNEREFNDLVNDLARITENLEEMNQAMDRGSREDNGGHVDRNLNAVNKRLVASQKLVDKLGKGPLQVHSGPSYAHFRGMCSRIARANRIHDTLSKVSTNFRDIDGLLDRAALLVGISELSRRGSAEGADRHRGISSVPVLTHQEVLDFDGKDEDGNPTPEAQLKRHVLGKQSQEVVAAAGRHGAKVPSAQGMAGVGKTVALKGLGSDEDIREAFDEIHYISLGHDATTETVVSELARIGEISGGERHSSIVRACKHVSEAVSHTNKLFFGRKCLFLVDDVWKTDENIYGYLPALRQLLSSCKESRMVISTRDRNIAGEAGQAVEFGSRGSATSRKIFFSYFASDALDATSVEGTIVGSIERILTVCNGVPLVLGVAGRGARALKEAGRSSGDALAEYANTLERRQMSVLEESAPGYGRKEASLTLRAAMEISLEFLDRRYQPAGTTHGMCIGEMYRALGVLKAQAWAPLSMLSKLWNVNRGDAARVMEQLCAMSLTKWEDRTYKTASSNVERKESGLKIHDLQLEYCRKFCKEMRSLHGKLLDKYLEDAVDDIRPQGSDGAASYDGAAGGMLDVEPRPWWSARVAEDRYVHENVAWHLVRAGKRDELRGLLVDARWIKLRLVIGGIVALENDFAELVRLEDGANVYGEESATEVSDSEFGTILNALRCAWQYVVRSERELAVQLGGRLFDVQEKSIASRKLVESAIMNSERPFAEARYGFLPDARSGQINEVHLGGHCESLSYSSCGKYIAVGVKDVVVFESDTLAEKMRFSGHTKVVSSVCFLPELLKIVSGSEDGSVRMWDLSKPDDDAFTLKEDNSEVWSVCASGDGSRVASGSADGTVRLWNLQKEASEGEERRIRSKWMSWLCCSADDTNGTEEVDDAAYGCQVLRGHTDGVRCVCFSPDGALLASASNDGTVRLWNGLIGEHTGITLEGHEGGISCVAFSPDGERIASGASDGTIRLWRADTGAPTGIVIEGHSDAVSSVAFSADGARIVSASSDMTVRVWSAESGRAIGAALKGHISWAGSAMFSPDGAHVASVSNDKTLRMWEPERAGEVSAAREGHSSFAVSTAFSADGTRIAVGHDNGAIRIWDTQSGRAVGGTLEGHSEWVRCLAFSPDGALLASGSFDETVRLWNVCTGAAVRGALEGHSWPVTNVLFSADGSKLLSHSNDDSYPDYRCVWSVPSGTLLWMSHRSSEDAASVMSDEEALRVVEAIESQSGPGASKETAVVYYDREESAAKMKRNEGDVRLATFPQLAFFGYGTWMHNSDRNEFVAVLGDGRPVCLTLHV